MGRKTYESIPKKYRPLSKRLNIILSRDDNYKQEGAYVYQDLEEVLSDLRESIPFQHNINYDQVFVIGGQQIYDLTMPLADKLEITHVKKNIEGDAFFPVINEYLWKITMKEDHGDYSFITYERNY